MTYPYAFEPTTTRQTVDRINQLTPKTQPQWGKMNVAQMLAHLNVAYDMAFGKVPASNPVVRFLLKTFVKKSVVGPKPYPKNARTAPAFLITDERDFEQEKNRLIGNIERVEKEGETAFEGRPSPSFGPLTAQEWSVLFVKHLDHHLGQFGV